MKELLVDDARHTDPQRLRRELESAHVALTLGPIRGPRLDLTGELTFELRLAPLKSQDRKAG